MKAATAAKMAWTGHEADLQSTRIVLLEYLRRLGVKEPALLDALATECLSHARRRVAPGLNDELLRRAIEEAQRRMDAALARVLDFNATRDLHALAGARAALLMCGEAPSTDFLFEKQEPDSERLSRLKAKLPVATPPETPRAMAPQKLEFLFFKSS